ncbi:MAG: SLC13 family permease [Solirubrobacteraceae bacterium]
MANALALILALALLAATLAVAVLRPPRVALALPAVAGALLLVAVGAISVSGAGHAIRSLAPTVGFLVALLLLAEGCREEGLFEAAGGLMARRSRGDARRLLGLVFLVASATTIVLGLDPTVVLLTPIVIVTAQQARTNPKPHVYACAHLANSASLLLPVSNLTNLLAFRASGLSFTRFALLMLAPTAFAVAVDWFALSPGAPRGRADAAEPPGTSAGEEQPLPRFALTVLALTLVGFALSTPLGIAPVWMAVAGAVVITVPALIRSTTNLTTLARAAQPDFLAFVLGLGVIVAAAGEHGLTSAVTSVLPGGASLPDLIGIAAVSALLANLVNNLPATLILVPVAASLGTGEVLAVLVGVNIGPNLTEVGSLATLLWRRVLHARGIELQLREFVRLGTMTVPIAILGATVLLWAGLQVF